MEENIKLSEKIETGLGKLGMPTEFLSNELAWESLQSKIASNNSIQKIKPNPSRTWLRIAAIFAILFAAAIGILLNGQTTAENDTANELSHMLPCGSELQLGQSARVAYNTLLWNYSRKISIEGQAYLNVKKGSNFEVSTGQAKIVVLGTAFTVWSSEKSLYVHCTEGKVKVKNGQIESVLLPDTYVQISNGQIQSSGTYQTSDFVHFTTNGIMVFDNLPVDLVCAALSHQSNVTIKNNLPENTRYSGNIDPNNPTQAIEILAKPFAATVTWLSESEAQIDP